MNALIRRSNQSLPSPSPSSTLALPPLTAQASVRPMTARSVTTQKLRVVAARNRGGGSPIATSASAALAPGSKSPASEALSTFAREHGIPNKELVQVMTNARGNALEAAKAYAVIADARNGKLTPDRARAMGVVLEALRDGRLSVQTADLGESHAEYNHQTNTLLCPREGFGIDAAANRATIIHEAQHAIQDAQCAVQDRYTSEAEGHEAAADYLLHSAGALVETSRGTEVSVTRAQDLIATFSEQCEAVAARALVARMVRQNIVAGSAHLNGKDIGESAADQLSAIASMFPVESFREVYARAVGTTGNERKVEALAFVMHKAGI